MGEARLASLQPNVTHPPPHHHVPSSN